jgi:hypothetical protein
LAGKRRLSVSPRPVGAPGKVPDLCIERSDGNITVEVKAPHREPLPAMHSGSIPDDSDRLAAAVDEANRQFARDSRNLLFLAPTTRTLLRERRELIKAFFGQTKIVPLDFERPGTRSGPAHTEFFAEGKLLKLWDRGRPRFTRISAVIAVREGFAYAHDGALPQNVSVTHVLRAPQSVLFPSCAAGHLGGDPQLIRDGDFMRWTDESCAPFTLCQNGEAGRTSRVLRRRTWCRKPSGGVDGLGRMRTEADARRAEEAGRRTRTIAQNVTAQAAVDGSVFVLARSSRHRGL